MVAGGVVPPGVVVAVDPPAGVGDVSTVKPNWPVGPSSPLGWRTDHATLHGPVGIGVLTATVTVFWSALSCGRPMLGSAHGSPLHATATVESPIGWSNVRTSCVGGVCKDAPSGGSEETRVSAWAPAGAAPAEQQPDGRDEHRHGESQRAAGNTGSGGHWATR